jgi:hypothetical protein
MANRLASIHLGAARLRPSLFASRAGSGGASPSHPKTSLLSPREVYQAVAGFLS